MHVRTWYTFAAVVSYPGTSSSHWNVPATECVRMLACRCTIAVHLETCGTVFPAVGETVTPRRTSTFGTSVANSSSGGFCIASVIFQLDERSVFSSCFFLPLVSCVWVGQRGGVFY